MAKAQAENNSMKSTTLGLLLAALLATSVSAESVKHSLYLEGTVIGAQRFRQGLKYVTKISLQEDVEHEAAESRRFCGNWEKQINRLRGKRIRVNLEYKEYAPNECRAITSINLLN